MENRNSVDYNSIHSQKLPNATLVLVLGILSIIGCCFYGIISVILAVVGLVLSNNDMKLYRANPSLYQDYSNLNAGRILCIIGLILGIIYFISVLLTVALVGFEALTDSDVMQQKLLELQEKMQ